MSALMEDLHIPYKPRVRPSAGCSRALIYRSPHCAHDLHRRVQREIVTADCFNIRNTPTEEGGRERQGHPPPHPKLVGSMGAQGIRSFRRRHSGHKPSSEANGTAAGDGGKCAEGLCPHAPLGKYMASRPTGHWLGQRKPPPPN